jgi:hypothetical protein
VKATRQWVNEQEQQHHVTKCSRTLDKNQDNIFHKEQYRKRHLAKGLISFFHFNVVDWNILNRAKMLTHDSLKQEQKHGSIIIWKQP